MVQNLPQKISFNKRHEAHQIDERNLLNMKMYVVGPKNPPPPPHVSFFQGSQVVKNGQKWPAKFRHCHFVIGKGGWEPPPPSTLSIPSAGNRQCARCRTVGMQHHNCAQWRGVAFAAAPNPALHLLRCSRGPRTECLP